MNEYGMGVADALKHGIPGIHTLPCADCILIVEDFDAIRALMARHYEREGFTVYSASTPKDAMIIARTINPVIVVLDYDLSHANPLDTLRALRQELPHSIIILTGGNGTSILREKALTSGASDLLAHGYDLTMLDRLISQAQVS